MSADAATAPSGGVGSAIFGYLQRIGRSLMMPIAVLPAAALLLRFGQADMLGKDGVGQWWSFSNEIALVLGAGGDALFSNLPILFAIGVAIGLARKADGMTGLSALVGYLVFDRVTRALFAEGDDVLSKRVTSEIDGAVGLNLAKANPTGVLGGIMVGVLTALLWQRFYRIKLPQYLAFFGGRRFVPIVTAVSSLLMAVAFGLLWPPIGAGLDNFGEWLTGAGALGAGIYGVVNRLLIPFGLHHIVNSLVWFVFGEYNGKTGDLNRFFAGDPDAGTFMTGFFPVMMFGLPAAALAMVHTARPERRAVVGGFMASAALTSFLTGITEPIEFAFLFVAPVLYVVHALLTGVSMALCEALGVKDGFGFSAGAIDYLLNWGQADKPWMILIIGAVYAVVYYFLFRFMIQFFDLKTPGREPDDEDVVSAEPAAPRAADGNDRGKGKGGRAQPEGGRA